MSVTLALLCFTKVDAADGPGFERAWGILERSRAALCQSSRLFAVDWRTMAGVVLAENALNVGFADRVQDGYLSWLLSSHDTSWFSRWVTQNEAAARDANTVRLVSNKWPVELWASGYVQSFGVAQITPRTALLACAREKEQIAFCRKTAKQLLRAIGSVPDFLYVVAAVLRYEREAAPADERGAVGSDPALWATIYNVGGEFFFSSYRARYGITPNRLGRFVREMMPRIEVLDACR